MNRRSLVRTCGVVGVALVLACVAGFVARPLGHQFSRANNQWSRRPTQRRGRQLDSETQADEPVREVPSNAGFDPMLALPARDADPAHAFRCCSVVAFLLTVGDDLPDRSAPCGRRTAPVYLRHNSLLL